MGTPVIVECETTFNTAENTMTQMFSERVKLVVDFKHKIIVLMKDNDIADKFSFEINYTLQEFERYQRNVMNLLDSL